MLCCSPATRPLPPCKLGRTVEVASHSTVLFGCSKHPLEWLVAQRRDGGTTQLIIAYVSAQGPCLYATWLVSTRWRQVQGCEAFCCSLHVPSPCLRGCAPGSAVGQCWRPWQRFRMCMGERSGRVGTRQGEARPAQGRPRDGMLFKHQVRSVPTGVAAWLGRQALAG